MKKRNKGNIADDSPIRRILIVTGHDALLASLRDLVNLESDLTVGGEAADLTGARLILGGDHLDLAIVDRLVCPSIGFPEQMVFPMKPKMPLILMAMDNELAQIRSALTSGVRGFVAKQDLAQELIAAIRDVLDGQRYFSRELLVGISADVRARILAGDTSDWNE